MNIKFTKIAIGFLASVSIGLVYLSSNSVVSADTVEKGGTNSIVTSEKISPYVIEFKSTPKTVARSSDSLNKNTMVTLDFSEATFLDEQGKTVDKDSIMVTMVPDRVSRSAGTSGGTWQSGSGYAVCRGMKVTGNSGAIGLQVKYTVDFQKVQGGFDRLDRVYGTTVDGLGTWSYLANGVFRSQETSGASAYGGVKGQWTVSPGFGLPSGTSTKYLYFRVGNDSFWLEHNL